MAENYSMQTQMYRGHIIYVGRRLDLKYVAYSTLDTKAEIGYSWYELFKSQRKHIDEILDSVEVTHNLTPDVLPLEQQYQPLALPFYNWEWYEEIDDSYFKEIEFYENLDSDEQSK